jgi:GNAT superfamily N-acetyltransferase
MKTNPGVKLQIPDNFKITEIVVTQTIRPFCPEDADSLAALWYASWRSTGVQTPARMTAADLRQRVDKELSAGWEVFVAEYEGVILGFVALKRFSRCLDQLFVIPNAKRRGIGKKLFDFARTMMPEGFWLRTAAENKEARAFYDAAGMTLDRTEPHPQHGYDTAVYVIGKFKCNPSVE